MRQMDLLIDLKGAERRYELRSGSQILTRVRRNCYTRVSITIPCGYNSPTNTPVTYAKIWTGRVNTLSPPIGYMHPQDVECPPRALQGCIRSCSNIGNAPSSNRNATVFRIRYRDCGHCPQNPSHCESRATVTRDATVSEC